MLCLITADKKVPGASLVTIGCIDNKEYFLLIRCNYGSGTGMYTAHGRFVAGSQTGFQVVTRKAYDDVYGYLVVLPQDVVCSAQPGNWPAYVVRATGLLSNFSACLNHEHLACKVVTTYAKAILYDHEVHDNTGLQPNDSIQWMLANG
jgi:hypothetical protein